MKDIHGRIYREEAGTSGGGGDGAGAGDGDGDGGSPSDNQSASDGAGPAAGGGDNSGGDASGKESWRVDLAGGNEDYAKRMERYSDKGAFVEAAMQAHEKIRRGEIGTGLPDEPTDAQLKDYREANNIPVDGKYDLHLESGLEMDEKDWEIWGPAFEIAHQGNVNNVTMSAMTNALLMGRNQVLEERKTQDATDSQSFGAAARDLWGGDFDTNMQRISNRFNMIPEEVRDDIMHGRDATGKPLGSNLNFLNWIVGMDRTINPIDALPGDGENQGATAEKIIADGKQRMLDDRRGWGKDQPAQARYMQAVDWIAAHKRTG